MKRIHSSLSRSAPTVLLLLFTSLLFLPSCGGGGGGGGVPGAVDPGSLDTQITKQPADRTANQTVTVEFQGTGPVASAQGRLDGGDWQNVQSPWSSPSLDDGEHVFEVRAVAGNGTPDPTPAEARWTVDTTGPDILMGYPGNQAFTEALSSSLFGMTEDLGTVERLEVDGVALNSTNGFATWRTLSVLDKGSNTIEVVAVDDLGNRSTRQLAIRNDSLMLFPSSIGLDRMRDQAIVAATDAAFDEGLIYGVDLQSGETTLISGRGRGIGTPLGQIGGVFVENNGNRAFVSQPLTPAIVAVDLRTGDRTEISGPNQGSGENLFQPGRLVHDPFGGVLYVAETVNGKVFRIEVSSGFRSVFWQSDAPTAVSFEWDNRMLFVYDLFDNEIHWISTSGAGEGVISDGDDGQDATWNWVADMTWDLQRRSFLYVVDRDGSQILSVDLDSGVRKIVGKHGDGAGPLVLPVGLVYDVGHDRIRFVDQNMNAVVTIAPGEKRRELTGTTVGKGPKLRDVWSLLSDRDGNLLCLDRVNSPYVRTIDATTGQRGSVPDASGVEPQGLLSDLAAAPQSDQVFLADSSGDQLLALDRSTGEITLVSGNGRGQGIGLVAPSLIEVSDDVSTVWVFDSALASILEIDVSTGDRKTVSGPQDGGGPMLPHLRAMELDEAGGRLFVSDNSTDLQVLSIDLQTGDRALVSDASQGGPPASYLSGLAWDAAGGRLLATGYHFAGPDFLIAIDAGTGSRTELSGPGRGEGLPLETPEDLVFDAERNRCFVSSGYTASILVVDLESGDRAIFSK